MKPQYFAFLLLIAASVGFLGADTVSFNSGGDENIIINSAPYVEGVFSLPALCGNSVVEVYEGCDDGNTNDGDGCSSTCQVEPEEPGSSAPVSSGSGGGGGASGTPVNGQDIIITPPEVSATVIQGVEETREVTFRNVGESTLVFLLSVSGDEIKDVISLSEDRFVISSNGAKTILVTINDNSKELLAGKILVSYSNFVRVIPVIIGTKTDNFLFDTSVFLSDEFRKMVTGSKLTAQFNLKEINTNEKVDVVSRYVIKDFDGNKYYEDTETYFVQGEKEYTKEFPTQNLPEGKYVLGFEVSYPGAFAVSSATFDVENPQAGVSYKMILGLVAGLAIILAIIWVIRRRKGVDSLGQGK